MSELRGLQLSIDEIRETGAKLVAVTVDSTEQNRDTVGMMGLSFPLLHDPEAKAIRAFGVLHEGAAPQGHDIARPAIYLIDEGEIRWRHLADNYRVRFSPEKLTQTAHDIFKSGS